MRLVALFFFFLALAVCGARPSDKNENLETAKISAQKRGTIESQDFGDLLQEQKVVKVAKSQPVPLWKKSLIPSKMHQHLWGSRTLRDLDESQSHGLWGRSVDGHNGLWGRSLQNGLWGRSLQNGLWGRSLGPQHGLWGRSLGDQHGLWGRSLQNQHGLWGRSLEDQSGLWGRSLEDQSGLWGRSLEDQAGLWGRSFKAADSGVNGLWGRSSEGPAHDSSSRSKIPMWGKRFGPTKIGVWGRALKKVAVQRRKRPANLWGKRSMNEAPQMTSASEARDAEENN